MIEHGSPVDHLASVIVHCFNHLESTRRCITALARHTRLPWELIAVDNGSTGGVTDYLAGVRDVAPFRVEVVCNAESFALADAYNQGLAVARGEYLVLLNNDAVVTDAWLDQLVALVESNAKLGMVGPVSNYALPPQLIERVPYADADGMHRFASRWRDEHRGQWMSAAKLSGSCLLIKRRALEAVRELNERPGLGLFEELAMRVEQAGFTTAVAYDLFVHAGPWPVAPATEEMPARTQILTLPLADFVSRYGNPDTGQALCGYTPPQDTHAVLTLLAHARPHRVLEVGTALGHMTANLTEWSPDDASVISIGVIQGHEPSGVGEQACEVPAPNELGRLVGHFGKGHKAEVVAIDSRAFDFGEAGSLDFAFIDGGHGFEQALYDSRAAYASLAPGGWLVWHDVGHPEPWIKVREAIELAAFPEAVEHIEGTMVAFLRKGIVTPAPGLEPLRLMWEGDFNGLHSLGLINRALGRALIGRGVDLGITDVGVAEVTPDRLPAFPEIAARRNQHPAGGDPQVWIAHRWPPRLDRPPEGRWVFYQPWEYGSLPKAWLPAARDADEVWAYSHAVRQVYLDAGLPPHKVHVVPLGVDPEIFRPGVAPAVLPDGPSFRFLFVGGTIHRKGIDVLVAAYERAFKPGEGVGLVVQDMGTKSFYRGQTAGAALGKLRRRGYLVEYREEALDPASLAGLYAACDCAVQPYRGEGFALPVAEAMACGLPVIVTGAGPVLDYASEETAFLVPARRAEFPEDRVGEVETVGRPWLWEPDVEALADAMRRVVADPGAARARGKAASRHIHGHFTWAHAAAVTEARLRNLAKAVTLTAPRGVDQGGPRPRVSLTMIVRDEEANLPACLGSAEGLFDEIIVVDTGSTDRTVEIAKSFGARVFDFVWVSDFAAARNAALARATGDYAFWLDADDVIDPPQREVLKGVLANLRHGDEAAYVVKCACDPDGQGGGGQTVVDHVRLFPAREEVRWTYRVHEQILPALRRARIPVRWTSLTVRHTGYTDLALRHRKLGRDEAILLEELADRPGDPFVLFNLGSIAVEREDWQAALNRLRASLDGSAPTDSITRKLFALIARCHQMLGESDKALAACAAGLRIDGDDAELLFREAVIRRNSGDRAGAESCWRRILTLRRPEKFASIDQGIYGHLTRRNLASLAEERGDRGEARRLWGDVLVECPGDREAQACLRRLAG